MRRRMKMELNSVRNDTISTRRKGTFLREHHYDSRRAYKCYGKDVFACGRVTNTINDLYKNVRMRMLLNDVENAIETLSTLDSVFLFDITNIPKRNYSTNFYTHNKLKLQMFQFRRRRKFRSFGLENFFNHYKNVSLKYELKTLYFRVKWTKRPKNAPRRGRRRLRRPIDPTRIGNLLHDSRHEIRRIFHNNIVIPNRDRNEKWAMIMYKRDNLRGAFLAYFNRKWRRDQPRNTQKYIHVRKGTSYSKPVQPINSKNEFIAFPKTQEALINLNEFLIKNGFCDEDPKIIHCYNPKRYMMRWRVRCSSDISVMKNLWEKHDVTSKRLRTYIRSSNNTEYRYAEKTDALDALHTLTSTALKRCWRRLRPDDPVFRLCKATTNRIISTAPEIKNHAIAKKIRKFPFLHFYAPKNKVIRITKETRTGLTFLCLNIDNQITRLQNDHPYIKRILTTHNPDIMGFLDTGLSTLPKFTIPGYSLTSQTNADDSDTGGLLIYQKNSLGPIVTVRNKNKKANVIWLDVQQRKRKISIAFGYCRPKRPSNNPQTTAFYNCMNRNIDKIRKNSKNPKIIADELASPLIVCVGNFKMSSRTYILRGRMYKMDAKK